MATKRNMMLKVGDSTFDKIQAFYVNPDAYPLSDSCENIRQRWVLVINLILRGFAKYKIANMLEKDYALSQAQAYLDIKNATSLFGDINTTSKEVEKAIWREWCRDLIQRAKRRNDLKAEAKALDMYAKYGDFAAEELSFDPEKLEKKDIEINVDPKLIALFKKMILTGVVDFNKLDVTDIELESNDTAEEEDN
jgi:predicted transcriptional regulator